MQRIVQFMISVRFELILMSLLLAGCSGSEKRSHALNPSGARNIGGDGPIKYKDVNRNFGPMNND